MFLVVPPIMSFVGHCIASRASKRRARCRRIARYSPCDHGVLDPRFLVRHRQGSLTVVPSFSADFWSSRFPEIESLVDGPVVVTDVSVPRMLFLDELLPPPLVLPDGPELLRTDASYFWDDWEPALHEVQFSVPDEPALHEVQSELLPNWNEVHLVVPGVVIEPALHEVVQLDVPGVGIEPVFHEVQFGSQCCLEVPDAGHDVGPRNFGLAGVVLGVPDVKVQLVVPGVVLEPVFREVPLGSQCCLEVRDSGLDVGTRNFGSAGVVLGVPGVEVQLVVLGFYAHF